jgi:hypothetical protein
LGWSLNLVASLRCGSCIWILWRGFWCWMWFSLLKLCPAIPGLFGCIEADVPVVLFHTNLYRLSYCLHWQVRML